MKNKTVTTEQLEPGMVISLGGHGTNEDCYVYNIVLKVTKHKIVVYRVESESSFKSDCKLQMDIWYKGQYEGTVWNLLNLTRKGFSLVLSE